jgi:6-pyruvoyltetrahydropterin/6-carboxytetrahydropterin synthase
MRVTVCRREHFNAAHRLFRPEWSAQENFDVFGKCANPNYHGHNYDLTVKVTGEPNPETGYVMDMKVLSGIIKREVTDKFDHMNLNLDTTEFASLNPTAENISVVIWNLIRPFLPESVDLSVTLYETERNFVEYAGA